jgi:eukaryotic-like serine/threonine-protein kinase
VSTPLASVLRICKTCKALLPPAASTCRADGGPAEEVDTLPPGTRLGAYKIERTLGEGGMGFVYEATHEVLARRTAIKLLRPALAEQADVVTRFLNEAKAVNVIDHQHIISVYDYGDGAEGCVYFVMEYLEGETLDDLMRKRRPMAMPLFLHVFGQVAKALAAAHAKQIVHRDLKPANVFVVTREGNPYFIKLLDFGIAQLRGAHEVKGLTVAGSIMGTPQYMAPEQISAGAIDARADVWAMGVMMYRAATGEAPFKGHGFAELAGKILLDEPTPAGQLAQLPAALAKLIASCLEKKSEDRCQSIAELVAGLDKVRAECKLDDEAILTAVRNDAGAISEALPVITGEQTSGSLAGSLPQYQGALPVKRAVIAGTRSRRGLYAAGGVAIAAAAIAAYAAFGGGSTSSAATTTPPPPPEIHAPAQPPPPVPVAEPTLAELAARDDRAGVRAGAERDLRAAITSGKLSQQGFAVDALALARTPAAAALLHLALGAPPDVRVKAARALADIGLPDSAPKVRAALAESGDKLKVELAAALYKLGDADARAILRRAVEDPGMRLIAAVALAEGADPAGRAVLVEVMEATPPGREQWRRAAAGLARLGDASARAALTSELTQVDAVRSIGAAETLARGGDGKAREYLARVAVDPDATRPGEAALALARLHDRAGLGWIAAGFKSTDVDERKTAIAVCAALGAVGEQLVPLAKLATHDPDHGVRMTARAALLAL